jgi:hypothetical protein
MASIINEVESVGAFVAPVFPGAKVWYQNVPIEPVANELVVRYLSSDNTTETGYHYRLNRDYQIVYFAQNEFACLQKFEALERRINDTLVIPLKNSERYLRLESFSFSQPFKTEAGTVTAILGVLSVHVREARTQETSEKINNVNSTINK